jgi:hypothetical protein
VPDISEEVELVFFDSDGKRTGDSVIVQLTKRKQPLSIAAPANAVFVEIDPDRRYPWKRSRKLNSGRYPIP